MNNLEAKFSIEMKKTILLLWNLNNREQCEKVDFSTTNFDKLIYENKKPKFVYTIRLSNGNTIHKDQVNKTFKNFVNYLSCKTIECLTNREIS